MLKNINLLLIAFYLLTFSVPVFAGGFNSGSSHFTVNHNAFYRHKSRHTNQSYAKHKLKSHRKWHHKRKSTNKIKFPYYALYGRNNLEKEVEINIINITDDNKDEQIESDVDKDKSFSPPHIVNLEDIAPQKSTKSLKASTKQENVILIYGTKVIEKTIPSD
jgi:hypothetical protein